MDNTVRLRGVVDAQVTTPTEPGLDRLVLTDVLRGGTLTIKASRQQLLEIAAVITQHYMKHDRLTSREDYEELLRQQEMQS